MDNQRYLVIIVRPPSEVASVPPGGRVSLLLPFSPEAVISTFIEEIWQCVARHDDANPLTAETHNVSLRLERENGPEINAEGRLSDVIVDTQKEKILAVFSQKVSSATEVHTTQVSKKSFNVFRSLASLANAVLV